MKNISISWQLIVTDMFDRETPPKIEEEGTEFVGALFHLWELTLKEGITEDGKKTFNRFHLKLGPTEIPNLSTSMLQIDLSNPAGLKNLRQSHHNAFSGEEYIGSLVALTLKMLELSPSLITIEQASKKVIEFMAQMQS
jgi:hypothetical protein